MNARTLLLLVTVAAAAAYTGHRHARERPDAVPEPAAATSTAAARAPLYWHDPMYPQQRFDRPGKSPFMDMDLVPVYADDGADASSVRIDPGLTQNLGVRLATVEYAPLRPIIEAVGTLRYDERATADVTARAAGFVERLHVRAAQDPVHRGQALATLYHPDWVAAQEDFRVARRIAAQEPALTALVDGARQRLRLAGMPAELIAEFEASEEPFERVTLRAPLDGIVTELGVREGATVATGDLLFRINGLATMWLEAEVPEGLAATLVAGAAIEATLGAHPDEPVPGVVSRVLPALDSGTRTVRARIELDNRHGRLKPGMFARVRIAPPAAGPVLRVPSEAVIATGTRTVVIVASANGRYTPIPVTVGIEAEGMSEIRTGLTAGQRVVASGQFLIDSEASLKGVAARLAEPPAGAAQEAHDHAGHAP